MAPSAGDRPGGAFAYREFRLLWIAQITADMAANMQLFAVNWHIFELLQGGTLTFSLFGLPVSLSAAAVGLGGVGFVRLVPTVVFGILGGVLADAADRRRLMMWTRLAVAFVAIALAAAEMFDLAGVIALYIVSTATAALSGFDTPARQSLIANAVPPTVLGHAVSLFALAFRLSAIAAPFAAAVMIDRSSLGACYTAIAAFFLVPAACLRAMRIARAPDAPRPSPGLAAVAEAIVYVRGQKVLWGSMLLDFYATCFASLGVLLPILAEVVFDAGVHGYGLLATGQPLGAVAISLVIAWWHRLRHQGPLMLGCVAGYGLAAVLVALSRDIWLSFAMLTLMGGMDTVSSVIRGTIRQLMTPDNLRGRVNSIGLIFFRGGPRLGEMLAGGAAAVLGAPLAIFAGGLATVAVTAAAAWRFPVLLRYDDGREFIAGR